MREKAANRVKWKEITAGAVERYMNEPHPFIKYSRFDTSLWLFSAALPQRSFLNNGLTCPSFRWYQIKVNHCRK